MNNNKNKKWIVFITVGIYNALKPLLEGLSYEGDVHYTNDIRFFSDLTYEKITREVTSEQ